MEKDNPRQKPQISEFCDPERDFEEKKEKLEKLILRLGTLDKAVEGLRGIYQLQLEQSSELLQEMKEQFPNDSELLVLEKLLEDIKADFGRGEEIWMDDGMEAAMAVINEQVGRYQVLCEVPDNPELREHFENLRSIGIEPAYLVLPEKPSNRTIVLFAQIHETNFASTEELRLLGVLESQHQIFDSIKKAKDQGIVREVYAEGVQEDEEITEKNAPTYSLQATRLVKSHLLDSSQLTVRGYENELHGWIMGRFSVPPQKKMKYRSTAHNIFLGDSIADSIRKSGEEFVFAVIGAGHEFSDHNREEHKLPISRVLAHEGFNVIVVDAASTYYPSQERFKEYFSELDDGVRPEIAKQRFLHNLEIDWKKRNL